MTKDDLRLLFAYDRWANHRLLQVVSGLTPEQFTSDLGGGFPSVRDTVAHIIGGQWIWLAYWKATTHDDVLLEDLRKQREAHFHKDVLSSAAAVRSKCEEVEKEMAELVNGLTDQGMAKLLPARNTRISLAQLMQHVANHSTYHRGQVALMLRQLGAEAPATDFHVFLAEGRGDSQSA
jgi:uncharacterized damage-inducible protein DinB